MFRNRRKSDQQGQTFLPPPPFLWHLPCQCPFHLPPLAHKLPFSGLCVMTYGHLNFFTPLLVFCGKPDVRSSCTQQDLYYPGMFILSRHVSQLRPTLRVLSLNIHVFNGLQTSIALGGQILYLSDCECVPVCLCVYAIEITWGIFKTLISISPSWKLLFSGWNPGFELLRSIACFSGRWSWITPEEIVTYDGRKVGLCGWAAPHLRTRFEEDKTEIG